VPHSPREGRSARRRVGLAFRWIHKPGLAAFRSFEDGEKA